MASFPTPKTRDELDAIIEQWIKGASKGWGTIDHPSVKRIKLVEWLAMHGVRLTPEEPTEEQTACVSSCGDILKGDVQPIVWELLNASPYKPKQR